MLKFSDPRAVQALDAAIATARAAGKLADAGRWHWAYAIGLPIPPSDSAIRLATQVFDAGVTYGTATPAFQQVTADADAIFATLKPGWLGSILGAVAGPAVIAISTAVGGEAIAALAGGAKAATSAISKAPDLGKLPDLGGLGSLMFSPKGDAAGPTPPVDAPQVDLGAVPTFAGAPGTEPFPWWIVAAVVALLFIERKKK